MNNSNTNSQKFTFPIVKSVRLKSFSLYNLQPNINIDIPTGVFVLAGANGLGKSTFLAAINFGITGVVPDPDREFKSIDEYYRLGYGFSHDYFDGRIKQIDRETASIALEFILKGKIYRVERSIFAPDELQEFSIIDPLTGNPIHDTVALGLKQRHAFYKEQIVSDTGIASFEQFVFLQHFVFTFDESRHLLLWDEKVLTPVLNLIIGQDAAKAEHFEQLRREMERSDSRARNFTYQAGNVRKRYNDVIDALALIENQSREQPSANDVSLDEAFEQLKALDDEIDRQRQKVDNRIAQLSDVELIWNEASSELATLKREYEKEFSKQTHSYSHVEFHPVISATLSEGECAICGTKSSHVVTTIQNRIQANLCPLCESPLNVLPIDEASILARLQELDTLIAKAQSNLTVVEQTKERFASELKAAQDKQESLQSQKRKLEEDNTRALGEVRQDLAKNSDYINATRAALETLEKEIEQLQQNSKQEYAVRDGLRQQMTIIQEEIERRYFEVETLFVPLFKDLATLFLGIDMTISMNSINTYNVVGMKLVLEIRGNVRRKIYQLSESQRFFLDIALRMALAHYMVGTTGTSALFVDTPEGSLDIAYESRAGQMFARFARENHSIVMTANINSSQMLRRLALNCGKSLMTLHRMTSWTELSDVQREEEALFRAAYEQIESDLIEGDRLKHG